MLYELKDILSIKNLKNNIIFFLSGICFSLLIFHSGKMRLAIFVLAILSAGFISIFFDNVLLKFKSSHIFNKISSAFGALILLYICGRHFCSIWLPSSIIARIASKINISNKALLAIISVTLAVLAFYFLCLLFSLLFRELHKVLISLIRFKTPKELLINLKSNVVFIISAFAFMGLNVQLNKNGILSLALSYFLIIAIFSQTTDIISKVKSIPLFIKIYSAVSTFGICYYSRIVLVESISASSFFNRLFIKAGINLSFFLQIFSSIAALISCIIVFALVSVLLNFVVEKLKTIFCSISKTEIILFSLLIIFLLTFVCFAFFGSRAFWGTKLNYDIIYTSDSSNLVSDNVYLRLYHPENDLRQPLFAVFSAPFVGFGYALSLPFAYFSPVFTPLFMNFIQVILMILANFILAKILNLNSVGRICFMLLSSVTYPTLLFSIMMEQYILAYFWVVFSIYSYLEFKNSSVISLTAAGGTLLTSLVLLPTSHSNTSNKLHDFVFSIEKSIFGFFVILLTFGRLDVLLNFLDEAAQLSGFARGRDFIAHLNQYLSFISSCFISPDAAMHANIYSNISWQLSDSNMSSFNILGFIILLLCMLSFIVNRKNKITNISALWVCFSILLLCVAGWGSAENGMILYSLYFGWAFFVLLFQLVNWLAEIIHFKTLVPILSGVFFVMLSVFNYHGMKDLLSFVFTYYPL